MMPSLSNRAVLWIGGVLFCIGIALTATRTIRQYQTPGPFDPSAQGMCDFHNGIYFPTRALLAGISPYGQQYADQYPVARQIPFFSPGILVLHAPLTFLPLRVAEVIYFLFCVALVIAIAMLCASAAGVAGRWHWIMAIAAGIVFSRSGHITLFNGYFTLELVLATFVAIRFGKERPMLSALALMVVSAKPTYILPLGFLLLARRNFRALISGALLSLLAAGLPMLWLSHQEGVRLSGESHLVGGFRKVLMDIQAAQEVHMNMADESPVQSWTRIDLLASICKFTLTEPSQFVHLAVMALMLIWPMAILFWRSSSVPDDGLAGGTGALILLALISSLYHQSYDALLVTAPVVGAAASRITFWRTTSLSVKLLLSALMLFPAFNYLSTQSVLSRLQLGDSGERLVTSLNGFALAAALVLVCVMLTRRQD